MKQARQIFRDAIFLTVASLLMRTVGVAFQIAISNRAGAEIMGLYSLMAGVYGFALTLATSGIHLGVTRLVSERLVRSDAHSEIRGFMKTACRYALMCGGGAAFLLFFGADLIGTRWIQDPRTIPSLRCFSLSLPLIALSSVFGGYFTAIRKSRKSAILQITEQFVKITLTMRLLVLIPAKSTEALLCVLVLGGVGAELFSFLMGWLLYLTDRTRKEQRKAGKAVACGGKELLHITLPMALTSYIRSGLLTIQHVLIPRGLKWSGASHAAALAAYGCIHSMALPIVLYPAALISSFSGLLIPACAQCHAQNRQKQIRYIVSRVWFFAMLFSVGAAGLLICFSQEFGAVFYPSTDAGRYIRMLAPLIPIMYLDTATDAILKGLGEQLYSMKINILDAAVSVILVGTLVPRFGIAGYIVAIYISETLNTVCSVTRLLCITEVKVQLKKWVLQPLLCILAATGLGAFFFARLSLPFSLGIDVLLHTVITLLLYVILLILTRTVNREELSWGRSLLSSHNDGT